MKTLWEREKMLITSIFSFSNNVSYRIKREIVILAELILSSANAVGKGEIARHDSLYLMKMAESSPNW